LSENERRSAATRIGLDWERLERLREEILRPEWSAARVVLFPEDDDNECAIEFLTRFGIEVHVSPYLSSGTAYILATNPTFSPPNPLWIHPFDCAVQCMADRVDEDLCALAGKAPRKDPKKMTWEEFSEYTDELIRENQRRRR